MALAIIGDQIVRRLSFLNMRHFYVFYLYAAVSMAADFTTGQAARMVIGQATFTGAEEGASQSLIGAASGLAFRNDTLFVADSNRLGAAPINNRVLIYQHISSKFPPPDQVPPGQGGRCPACGGTASVVLGQPDFTKTDPASSQSGLRLPTAVATDGTA